MIINVKFQQNCWLDSDVLTSSLTSDVDFKHLVKIFRLLNFSGKIVSSLPCFFTV